MINDEPFLSYHMTKYFKGSIHALCTQKDESVYSSSEAVKPINNSTFSFTLFFFFLFFFWNVPNL